MENDELPVSDDNESSSLNDDDGWRLEMSDSAEHDADEWGGNDLEAAYRRALEANDSVDWGFDAEDAGLPVEADELVDPGPSDPVAADEATNPVTSPPEPVAIVDPVPARVTAKQVIEASLFVGGEPLTTKKLCYVLRGDYDLDAVEMAIEELNLQYQSEERPYEIRLGEGGYRLAVRYEYEQVRNRFFGIGPREVKLSQDVLEVLALVAYRQPITPEEIEALGKINPAPMLRQLLRRELVSLERDPSNRKVIRYSTTRRFLSVFGLGHLDDLPQADELAFK